MRSVTPRRAAIVAALLAMGMVAAACAPPAPPEAQNWSFRATQVTVNESQDGIFAFGACINFNCEDEPYVLNIGFRVKLGEPNSAQAFVVNSGANGPKNVPVGGVRTLTGAQQATVNFNDVTPLDLFDLFDENNKLEVVGVYSWASEEDFIRNTLAANGVRDGLISALNSTLAQSSDIPTDGNLIFNLIFNNILGGLGILVNNIPTLGFGDDVLGGALYVGIGAKGGLADVIDSAIGSAPAITFNSPVQVPPSIQGGGFFTFNGTKNFTQTFNGSSGLFGVGGRHTYNFQFAQN